MSRENRTDKMSFIDKDNAIEFAKSQALIGYKLFLSPSGTYSVKKYTKGKGDLTIGNFALINGKFKYFDYEVPVIKTTTLKEAKANMPIRTGRKAIDGEKFKNYILEKHIDKHYLCGLVHKSRSFINDVIRYNNVDILCMEKICEYLGVPDDYFDKVENVSKQELEVEETKEEVHEFKCEQIHDDLIALIASNRRLEVLMQEMIDMWKND